LELLRVVRAGSKTASRSVKKLLKSKLSHLARSATQLLFRSSPCSADEAASVITHLFAYFYFLTCIQFQPECLVPAFTYGDWINRFTRYLAKKFPKFILSPIPDFGGHFKNFVRAVVEKGLSKTRSTIDEKQPLDAV
jgi:hypothetical protein